jgi:hypothetical protein
MLFPISRHILALTLRRWEGSNTTSSLLSLDADFGSVAQCHYMDCPKFYSGKDARVNLRRHIRTAHEKKSYKCPKCPLETGRRDNLRTHYLKKHGRELPSWLANKARGEVNE